MVLIGGIVQLFQHGFKNPVYPDSLLVVQMLYEGEQKFTAGVPVVIQIVVFFVVHFMHYLSHQSGGLFHVKTVYVPVVRVISGDSFNLDQLLLVHATQPMILRQSIVNEVTIIV